MNVDDLVTPAQAGEILGISRQLVQYHCRKGYIPYRKVGCLILMLRKDVMKYKQSLGSAKAPVPSENGQTGKRTAKRSRTCPAPCQGPLRASKKQTPKQ